MSAGKKLFENRFAYASCMGEGRYVIGFKENGARLEADHVDALVAVMNPLLGHINAAGKAVLALQPPPTVPENDQWASRDTKPALPISGLEVTTVAIDLSHVGYIDRAGYELVREFAQTLTGRPNTTGARPRLELQDYGGLWPINRLVLAQVPAPIQSVMKLTGLERSIDAMAPTLSDAWSVAIQQPSTDSRQSQSQL